MAAPMSSVGKPSAERLPFNTTSFQKKTRSKLISIPGTRPSVQNGQLLVSTGVTSLDYLLGGGLAVGTVLLIAFADMIQDRTVELPLPHLKAN